DNYAPFYSTPIECTDRDAAFVLDGLLYNETDLPLEEHYTDTHGYTEINFAAFAMLGKRFCPRIRGVQHQRIYRIDPTKDYGLLEHFSPGCSGVTAMSEGVLAILGRNGLQGLGHGVPQRLGRPRRRFAQPGLDLGPDLLNRVEVRRVRRQVPHP